MKTPQQGNFWFAREIEVNGQRRGLYFSSLGFAFTLILAIVCQFIPPLIGFRPVPSAWVFPAGLAAFSIMFAASMLAVRIRGAGLVALQIGAATLVLTYFLTIFIGLGGNLPSPSEWWRLVAARPNEARDLVIVAAVISGAAGWSVNPRYPFRAAIIAAVLVFTAVWMNFQGYFVVLTDGYDWLLRTSSSITFQAENATEDDDGAAFATMLFATLASWLAILGVLGLRKSLAIRRSSSPSGD